MIHAVGNLTQDQKQLVVNTFKEQGMEIQFISLDQVKDGVISFSKESSLELKKRPVPFYNWDLLFSVLGPNDTEGLIKEKLKARIDILKSIKEVKSPVDSNEFHGSIRVHDLAASAGFYRWLFGVEPKEWTHRYVTFVRPDTRFNFVLLVSDGKELHHDTLYHLGMGVRDKEQVLAFYHSAVQNGFHIEKPPRTTWRGTPLHELWLKDPDGTLIEIYARLTEEELKEMPADKEPWNLV